MLTSLLSVAQQVCILFILMGVGFLCTKKKMLTEVAVESIAKVLLYTVTPCVIVESFNRPFDASMLSGLGIAALVAFGVHLFNIVLVTLFIRDNNEARRRVLQFGTVFSNCGYMALPLQAAILGSDGVFYGAAYIAVFNLFNWTYGLFLMGAESEKISVKKIFLNPGVISVTIGLILFLTPLDLPKILSVSVSHFAALNTPVPMLIIGFYLAGITSLASLRDKKLMLSFFLRLIVSPLVTLLILYLFKLKGVLPVSMIVAASAPTAANTVVFSAMYKRDTELAAEMISLSTLLSIITMPLIVSLAMSVLG